MPHRLRKKQREYGFSEAGDELEWGARGEHLSFVSGSNQGIGWINCHCLRYFVLLCSEGGVSIVSIVSIVTTHTPILLTPHTSTDRRRTWSAEGAFMAQTQAQHGHRHGHSSTAFATPQHRFKSRHNFTNHDDTLLIIRIPRDLE